MTYGFPAPYIVSDRSTKQVVDVRLSPYAVGILQSFGTYGMNPSQVVEWLIREYVNASKVIENSVQKEPKIAKLKKIKKQNVQQQPSKPSFVHTQKGCPVVKKVRVKPTKG